MASEFTIERCKGSCWLPLPEGFHLSRSGRLVAVPREEMDTVLFVTVTDAAGCQITQAFTLAVWPEGGPPAP